MWVDAERGSVLLSEHEVRDWAGAVTERLLAMPELQGRVPAPRVADAVTSVVKEALDRGAPEPVVLLEASEPSALQLVALLRSHRRDRDVETDGLDQAAQTFRRFTGR